MSKLIQNLATESINAPIKTECVRSCNQPVARNSIIFTRYLYIYQEVCLSLIIELLRTHNATFERVVYWLSELYYSGFQEMLWCLCVRFYYDFIYVSHPYMEHYIIKQFNKGVGMKDVGMKDVEKNTEEKDTKEKNTKEKNIEDIEKRDTTSISLLLSTYRNLFHKKCECLHWTHVHYTNILYENVPRETLVGLIETSKGRKTLFVMKCIQQVLTNISGNAYIANNTNKKYIKELVASIEKKNVKNIHLICSLFLQETIQSKIEIVNVCLEIYTYIQQKIEVQKNKVQKNGIHSNSESEIDTSKVDNDDMNTYKKYKTVILEFIQTKMKHSSIETYHTYMLHTLIQTIVFDIVRLYSKSIHVKVSRKMLKSISTVDGVNAVDGVNTVNAVDGVNNVSTVNAVNAVDGENIKIKRKHKRLYIKANLEYINLFKESNNTDSILPYRILTHKHQFKISDEISAFDLNRDYYDEDELKDIVWYKWTYYTNGCPLWDSRIKMNHGYYDHCNKTIYFGSNDDNEEDNHDNFYDMYGLEPDEQNREIQNNILLLNEVDDLNYIHKMFTMRLVSCEAHKLLNDIDTLRDIMNTNQIRYIL